MIDKSKELISTIKLVNDKLHFIGEIDANEPISIDYISPLGDDSGYTSLELLLLSLTSCIGSSVLTFLRRMNKSITNCEINAKGLRRDEHPTGFKQISINIKLFSEDVTEDDMNKVIKLSEDKYCPVWSMIKGNTELDIEFSITKP